mmetsp:Transcript_37129/g.100228  ORF Transcript_37129/g.100228 Transcript_37129/m.100228 type:complete len:194 (+) Transcript_37129:17-598(+)
MRACGGGGGGVGKTLAGLRPPPEAGGGRRVGGGKTVASMTLKLQPQATEPVDEPLEMPPALARAQCAACQGKHRAHTCGKKLRRGRWSGGGSSVAPSPKAKPSVTPMRGRRRKRTDGVMGRGRHVGDDDEADAGYARRRPSASDDSSSTQMDMSGVRMDDGAEGGPPMSLGIHTIDKRLQVRKFTSQPRAIID